MSPRTALLTTLTLLPVAYAATPRADRIAFDVAEDLTLEKTFEASIDMEMADLAVSFGGQEIDPSMMGDPQVELAFSAEVTVTDVYDGATGGRPTGVSRTYDSAGIEVVVAASGADGEEEDTTSATSGLEGETVVFRWDDEEEAFVPEYEGDGDGDEELLEGLEEDMDYRALLPEGEVSEGDSWQIDPEVLGSLLMPGGNLALEGEDGAEDEEIPEEILDAIESTIMDLFAGETTATYRGMREEDGVEVAAIEITIEVDTAADVADVLAQAIEASGEEAGVDFEAVDLALTFEGEGLLLWNVAGGHFQSFELGGDVFVAIDLAMVSEEMGGASFEASVEFEGSATFASQIGG